MEFEEISSKISEFVKRYWLPLALSMLGTLFILYGLISLVSNKPKSEVDFSQTVQKDNLASKSAAFITIDIEGAVVAPGVYKLDEGAIIQDALILAKGLSATADRDYVAKNINLAGKLSDAQKIYVPKTGEQPPAQVEQVSYVVSTGLININTASSQELDSLPGVGPVTAGKIIAARPFISTEDLLNKKVVTDKVYEEIKDKITAN